MTESQLTNIRNILSKHTDSKLVTHLNACVHCGLCDSSCLFYKTLKEPQFIPGKKVDLVASLYKRYNTLLGRLAPAIGHARDLTPELVEEMKDSLFGGCTMCGRCVKHCSIGVDIPFVVRTGRRILAELESVPPSLKATADNALINHNNMGIAEEDFVDTIQWMEEDLQDEMDDINAQIPINQENKNIFYTLNPREVKFFPLSIAAVAKIFHAAKEDWTLSSKFYDVTNYGFFTGDNAAAATIAKNMFDEVALLKAQTLVLGECGHGSRVLRWEAPNLLKQKPPFKIITLIELIEKYLAEQKITVDKSLNTKKYTIHDPCNITRNGGLFCSLRNVVKSVVPELIEMDPYGTENFCC
ncbi:MAG: (Fe-S)-binding protein, partial [Bacteroidales bacterium]|nr:(Fe-S)-binding protein [Bacteroidales bacterium]